MTPTANNETLPTSSLWIGLTCAVVGLVGWTAVLWFAWQEAVRW